MEIDSDSTYSVLEEKDLHDCVRNKKKQKWKLLHSEDYKDLSTADACSSFFPRTFSAKHKKNDNRESGLLKKEFRCTELLCLCSKTNCCYHSLNNKVKLSCKKLNKQPLMRVKTDLWQNVEKYWSKQKMQLRSIVDFAQRTLL